MSEQIPDISKPTFWTTGFMPNGVKVSFTVPTTAATAFDDAKRFTDMLLAAGFKVSEPGLGDGEKKEAVGYVCRRVKVNDDGSETPVISLYASNDALKRRFIQVYLNKPEDVTAFEQATGLTLDALPIYEGEQSPERGANPRTDRFVIQVKKPCTAITVPNERYVKGEMKPKNYFRRWDGVTAPAAGSQPPAPPQSAVEQRQLMAALVEIVEAQGADGNPVKRVIYRCAGNVMAEASTLKHLADGGYSVKGWGAAKVYDLQPSALVTVEGAGDNWRVIGVKKPGTASNAAA